ncbi:serine hydrolase FSH [Massariosphaeria phaeospora]|uniref:Serine hydrolase FSH n=1 Tax=Massariosphaeria phaeospora TaxID=100035 RepID=A0A7C8M3J5_9PLEO|nr:serine hydrolase FSH [Massariosphaeria phaeospora]
MHFLCLHGLGSNSTRFQAQVAVIIAELGDEHTYDFVNGPVESAPAAELFDQLAWSKGKGIGPDVCYSFFNWYEPQSILDALDWLSSYTQENGPYDAVMAFSQSTCLTATLLLQHHALHPDAEPLFRCGVFFQGILPLKIEALSEGRRIQFGNVSPDEAKLCDDVPDKGAEDESVDALEPLGIPTAHVWGTNDTFPLPQGERLSHLFSKSLRTHVTHQDGHAIPGAKNMDGVRRIVRAIRKTTERAQMLH